MSARVSSGRDEPLQDEPPRTAQELTREVARAEIWNRTCHDEQFRDAWHHARDGGIREDRNFVDAHELPAQCAASCSVALQGLQHVEKWRLHPSEVSIVEMQARTRARRGVEFPGKVLQHRDLRVAVPISCQHQHGGLSHGVAARSDLGEQRTEFVKIIDRLRHKRARYPECVYTV